MMSTPFLHSAVISVDISESMLQMARANARIYEVQQRITFVQADAFAFLRETRDRFSAVLASPPWGGPAYSSSPTFSLSTLKFTGETGTPCRDFFHLLEGIACVTKPGGPVAFFLPKNMNLGTDFIVCAINSSIATFKLW